MEALEAIRLRCSIREYRNEPVPKEVIERIIDAGRLAPTARKEEPWEFIAITDKAMLKAIANLADHGRFIKDCACAIVVFCKDTKYYLEDGCAATENILLAAAASGLGSCWVAGDKKPYCGEVMKLLGVPSGYKLVSIVSMGYPAKPPVPLKKRTVKEVLHWERF